jgi:hypothetical protein
MVGVSLCDRLTALHLAAMQEQVSLVKLLLSRGADMSLRNNKGKTAQDVATPGPARVLRQVRKGPAGRCC